MSAPVSAREEETGRTTVLVVDDDETIRTQLKWALAKEYEVLLAGDRETALAALEKGKPSVTLLDLGLPPDADGVAEGFATLGGIVQLDPLAKVVVATGHSEREHALRAIGQGAYDFLSKPIQPEELKIILRRACYVSQLEHENREWQRFMGGQPFEEMLGNSPKILEVFGTIRKVATTEVSVLVMGENGTGKELVAKAIHRLGPRRAGPFVTINCAAIPDTLLESELFGHEKGAFTGAHIQRKGRIEAAQGGTLFLDEIGDLSSALQVKLLRFLQEHRIERVGGREEIEVDVRVIAATNRDLQQAMKEGRFREDLYYRLGVVFIFLPPLRERERDAALLANAFLQRFLSETGKKITGFTPQAIRVLEEYPWPGNIRELENRVKRAIIMAEGAKLTPADLDLDADAARYTGQTLKEARETLERELIQKALARTKGNITKAAAELGVSRPTIYELMEKLGLKVE